MSKPDIFKLVKTKTPELIDLLSEESVKVPSRFGSNKCPYTLLHQKLTAFKFDKYSFKVFLKNLASQRPEIFDSYEYVSAICDMYEYKDFWVRDISTWVKKSRSRDKQFYDIAHHLFVKYEMPAFMYNVWLLKDNNKKIYQEWFIHLGNGQNIRKCPGLPYNISKKVAHLFKFAPGNLKPLEAIRWAQVIDMGGNDRLFSGIMTTKRAVDFKENHFFESVIRFFIDNPMLDTEKYNPIVDYIWHVKYESRRIVNRLDLTTQFVGPEQPNFSMKDRNPEALLIAVERWHKETSFVKSGTPKSWQPMLIKDFVVKRGTNENAVYWHINQLTTASALATEGRQLGHCVGSYANSCSTGRTSIWSLNESYSSDALNGKKILTIELSKDKIINQVRGKGNRLPTDYELNIIQEWADEENISVSKWIKSKN